jgi:hypothetical protein
MKNIAIIIPTRSRPSNIQRLHEQWFRITDTSISTDCIIVLDNDNEAEYPRLEGFRYIVVHNTVRGVVNPLNQAAIQVCNEYEYLGFWGDDHFPQTTNWNSQFYNSLKSKGKYAMVYGDDGIQGQNLPTHIVMDSLIVRRLGYMGHPEFRHLYLDDFWKYIGNYFGTLIYMSEVKIEHKHYCVGKAPMDELYELNNSNIAFQNGRESYYKVINSPDFQNTLNLMKHPIPTLSKMIWNK